MESILVAPCNFLIYPNLISVSTALHRVVLSMVGNSRIFFIISVHICDIFFLLEVLKSLFASYFQLEEAKRDLQNHRCRYSNALLIIHVCYVIVFIMFMGQRTVIFLRFY